MHLPLSLAPLLLATLTYAHPRVRLTPFAGSSCDGDQLPGDTSGDDSPLHYCFDISDADSFYWIKVSKNGVDDDWAKFTYYSGTGCSGDVTAVKELCGAGAATCYKKHDPSAGSVFVQTPGNHDCTFFDEGEKECSPTAAGRVKDPTCDKGTGSLDSFPDHQ